MRALMKHWAMALLAPRPLVGLLHVPKYIRQYLAYKKLDRREPVRFKDSHPCLLDAVTRTPFDPHYFHQGAWLARRLVAQRPSLHVDVGSSVLSMSVLSAALPIVFVDYRPLHVSMSGFSAVAGSITQLPFRDTGLDSVSSLHVLEHIGLGRYGDPLDAHGSESGARELERVAAPAGRIYLSVPIGRERVCFNAHRVFSAPTVAGWFRRSSLIEFSYVDDEGRFHEKRSLQDVPELEYGCGMFIFERTS